MMKDNKFKRFFLWFIIVLVIILFFTFIDYIVHNLNEEYAVPSYYFRNKIIYGTIIGFFSYFIIRKRTILNKSLLFSLTISLLLQIRYFLEGYSKEFVFEFLIFHFLMLLPLSFIAFKIVKKYKLIKYF